MKIICNLILIIILLNSCQSENNKDTEYVSVNLKNVIAEIQPNVQKFKIFAKNDTILVTVNGSMLYIDAFTFQNKMGENQSDSIDIEIAEALNISEMIRFGLFTVSNTNGILESDGMIHINALHNNNQLKIANGKSIEVFLKNEKQKAGMSAWQGTIKNDVFAWKEIDSLNNYLIPIDLNLLDFSVKASMARFYVKKIGEVPDSLNISEQEALNQGLIMRDTLYISQDFKLDEVEVSGDAILEEGEKVTYCGISNDFIELLKKDQFQNTLISTKEFEYRMKFIHRTCDAEILKIYINNLNLNLWEVDNLVYERLLKTNSPIAENFKTFSNQKLTKIKDSNFDNTKITETVNEINKLDKKKRNSKRLSSLFYRFQAKSLGWYNIDKYWNRNDFEFVKMIIYLPKLGNIKKINLSLNIPNEKVIIPLIENKNGVWTSVYFNPENEVKLPIGGKAAITGLIQTSDNDIFIINHEFVIKKENNINVKVENMSVDEVIKTLDLKIPKTEKTEDKFYDCCNFLYGDN